jgi:2',3'-cyclic-nucleotide 2'-phosphodiesterase (5'-nucleotidase family)
MIAVMNAMGYDGMVLGNHEFNFGSEVFTSTFSQANFPLLGANVTDDGTYGISKYGLSMGTTSELNSLSVRVNDGYEYALPSGNLADPFINVGVFGLTNHRVPNYELPSNIPGLMFYDPIETAMELVPVLDARDDAVVALTHIGFTENPSSVEVDENVDTNLAMTVPGIDLILGSHSHTNPTTGFGNYKYLPAIVGNPDNLPVVINQAYRYNTFLGEMVLGFKLDDENGYTLVSTAGRDIAVDITTPEDPATKAIVDPYQTILNAYNDTEIGTTIVPIDTMAAFTEETNGANLQADASVWELKDNGIIPDFHLSGAMTNRLIASTATEATPYTLKISDMFAAMPYENSLVMISMNGPQIKAVLERAYRNYYYYKYVPGYGGYSYYPTCMLDTDSGNQIVYDGNRTPDGNNVLSFNYQGTPIDFSDADTYYNVSTVNYLAAGSCNFNDGGVSLWPLDQIVADTQFYVRDAVIDYISQMDAPVDIGIEFRILWGPMMKGPFLPMIFK